MKKITIIAIAALLLASCAKNFDRPPFEATDAPEGWVPNITIGQLMTKYNAISSNSIIDEDLYLEAVVTANDIGGNIYKKIFIQDTSGYGIDLEIDMTTLYRKFPVGQKIILALNGMYVGNYNSMPQLGYNYSRIPENRINDFIARVGLPYPENIPDPKVLTLAEVKAELDRYCGVLIKIDSVEFTNADSVTTFALPGQQQGNAVNRPIKDNNGTTGVAIRNSTESKFANQLLPTGKGSITCILGRFGTEIQAFLRTPDDLQNFDWQVKIPSGGGTGSNED
jgi:hypothetical protein